MHVRSVQLFPESASEVGYIINLIYFLISTQNIAHQ